MRISTAAFLMILTTVFLSACEQTPTATVDNRGMNFYARNGVMRAALPEYSGSYRSGAAPVQMASAAPQQQQEVPVMDVSSRDLSAPQAQPTQSAQATQPAKQVFAGTAQPARWQWPAQGKVIQNFGPQANGTSSQGITIAAAEGTPIRAAQSGEVAFVGDNIRDYGNMAIVRHADGTLTSYSHARVITVKKGDKVAAGGMLGYVGNSGSAKTPQLHFALREGERAVDPLSKLPQQLASN